MDDECRRSPTSVADSSTLSDSTSGASRSLETTLFRGFPLDEQSRHEAHPLSGASICPGGWTFDPTVGRPARAITEL
ncbi:hypothetical protein AArc1_1309 [Natrarchaeobaculum sulfurireducens]|uniref:Uncharacterized protein n=1 Tax=Natrarchaeobaculum sulfurireducens TaxID=2044521 RepID=A0A346PDQ2_9EURY|nr:hypothetical protein AArc1_1309 [Natrarchaeobaculum sulfurireducens]